MPEELRPFIETTVPFDTERAKRMGRRFHIFGLIMFVIGIIALVGYIAASTVFETLAEEGKFENYSAVAPWLNFPLWGGAIFFVLGLILLWANRLTKNGTKQADTYQYAFYAEHMFVTSLKNDEVVGTAKWKYRDFFRIRETDKFFMFFQSSTVCLYAVDKARLQEGEVVELRTLLNLPAGKK